MEPRISLIALGVADLERATRFYEECLRFPRLKTRPSVTFFQLGKTWLALWPREDLAADAGLPSQEAGSRCTMTHLFPLPKPFRLKRIKCNRCRSRTESHPRLISCSLRHSCRSSHFRTRPRRRRTQAAWHSGSRHRIARPATWHAMDSGIRSRCSRSSASGTTAPWSKSCRAALAITWRFSRPT